MEEVFKKLEWEGRGIRINGLWLNNLHFTEDIALLSTKIAEPKQMAEELNRESKKVGLRMNLSKTKIMSNSTEEEFLADGQKIEYVADCYLGRTISFEDTA